MWEGVRTRDERIIMRTVGEVFRRRVTSTTVMNIGEVGAATTTGITETPVSYTHLNKTKRINYPISLISCPHGYDSTEYLNK